MFHIIAGYKTTVSRGGVDVGDFELVTQNGDDNPVVIIFS